MSMQTPPWHSEVKARRANGIDPKAIAAQLRKSISLIRWVLDENGERQATLARVHEQRARARLHLGTQRATDSISERGARPIARAVSRETIDQAIRDFADHKIDRAALMARITPERPS